MLLCFEENLGTHDQRGEHTARRNDHLHSLPPSSSVLLVIAVAAQSSVAGDTVGSDLQKILQPARSPV